MAVSSYQCSPVASPAVDVALVCAALPCVAVGLECVIGVGSVGSGVAGRVGPLDVVEPRQVSFQ